jgi:hypothetical protein
VLRKAQIEHASAGLVLTSCRWLMRLCMFSCHRALLAVLRSLSRLALPLALHWTPWNSIRQCCLEACNIGPPWSEAGWGFSFGCFPKFGELSGEAHGAASRIETLVIAFVLQTFCTTLLIRYDCHCCLCYSLTGSTPFTVLIRQCPPRPVFAPISLDTCLFFFGVDLAPRLVQRWCENS